MLERAAGHSCGPYRVANVDVEARTVYTNNPPCGAMRGFGVNQAAFAIEGIMDRLAERVGIDGYDIRERNILDPGDRFATGQRMDDSCGIRRTLEAVREVYKSAARAGIACGLKNTGIGNGQDDIGRVSLDVLAPHEVVIVTGYTEMGQGLHTILRQIVSHETGLDPQIMTVRTTSRADVVCGMTTASRATALAGSACRIAARKLAESFRTPVILLTDANLATGVQPIERPEVSEEWFAPPIDQSAWDTNIAPYNWDESTGLSPRPIPGMRGGEYILTGLAHNRNSKIAYDSASNQV